MPALDSVKRAMRWHPPLMWFAAAMVPTALLALGGVFFDDRVLVGSRIWLKPLKFSTSFGLYAVSWAWFLSLHSRRRRWAARFGTLISVMSAIEMVIIVAQTLRGERSHFNYATPLDSALWVAMQATVVVLWLASLLGGILLARERLRDRALSWAIRLGVLISIPGMSLAQLMTEPTPVQAAAISRGDVVPIIGAHSVGVSDGGPALPGTGWSTQGGDLRIPHFVGLHALQVLPLLAVLLRRMGRRFRRLSDEAARVRLLWVGAGSYAGSVALLTWQALRGQPLLTPDRWTLAAAVLLLSLALAGALRVLSAPPVKAAPHEWEPAR